MRRDGPVKFEKDFDFESANAQFNKEEIEKEFQSKLKLKGWASTGFTGKSGEAYKGSKNST